MNRPGSRDQLHYLADLYGIRNSYLDMHRIVQPASDAALLAVLNAVGAPVAKMGDVPSAIRERRRQYWQQVVEPVIVSRDGNMPTVSLKLPAALLKTSFPAAVTLENGETREWVWRADESAVQKSALAAGSRYFSLSLSLPERLPPGYHQLKLDLPGRTAAALIISAPLKAFQPPSEDEHVWGAFIPLYALHSRRSWGAGDLADLSNLMSWISSLGGRLVGLLPLLPVFLNSRLGPGPYMPASRLFWNDFYLDIRRVPELSFCPEARKLMDSSGFQEALSALRASPLVDYRRQADLKRKVLELLLDCLLTGKSGRLAGFQSFINSHPALEDYAGFRAAGEKHGIDWRRWPQRMRGGKLGSGDFVDNDRQYHLYAQWLVQEQISDISQKARRDRFYLYLDLPVGVHPLSYDVWRERESFAVGVNGGAPPDPVFTSGQNWGFPPLHPEKLRRQGYKYIINSLRHHLQAAGMLRIDHMMNFHRLFWIPEGMENREGVYVNYRSEELYAILALESCRHQSVIIGEDLG
ncbi:MAG: 4-alpha-glucanotransferase, partial [Dehalococcoidales bacterium]|nr:4-alpha-glucanotransferase [Dehalococcoidales bacterium]